MQRWLPLTLLGAALATAALSPVQAQQDAAAPAADGADTGLPAGYNPPKPRPPVMDIDKPMLTEEQMKQLRQETIGFAQILRAGELTSEARTKIPKWATMRVYDLANPEARTIVPVPVKVEAIKALEKDRNDNPKLPKQPDTVADRRSDLQRELAMAGDLQRNLGKKEEFRAYVCGEIAKKAQDLLDNQFLVRLNAAWLLADLEVGPLPEQIQSPLTALGFGPNDIPKRAFAGSHKALISILKAPTGGEIDQQMEAVKVVAARGLGKIALTANNDLQISEKQAIADALIGELGDPKANWWYQQALIEALGNVDLVNLSGDNKPVILDTLGKIMTDPGRSLCVRAEAARAIGRIPLPQGVNMDTLVHRIVLLAKEMTDAQRKAPMDPRWTGCFAKLYLAFHPAHEVEQHLYQPRGAGLTEKQPAAAIVQDGFKQILPLVAHTQTFRYGRNSTPQKLPDEAASNLTAWLTQHTPGGNKLAPYLDDLPAPGLKAAAAGTNGVE
jgi:hypothetical protein